MNIISWLCNHTCSGSNCMVPSWYTMVTTNALTFPDSSNKHSLSSCERRPVSHTLGSEVKLKTPLVVAVVPSSFLSVSEGISLLRLDPDRLGTESLGDLEWFGLLHPWLFNSFCGRRGCLCLLMLGCGSFGFRSFIEPFTFALWKSCEGNLRALSVFLRNSCDEVILGASCEGPGGSHFPVCFGNDFISPACMC